MLDSLFPSSYIFYKEKKKIVLVVSLPEHEGQRSESKPCEMENEGGKDKQPELFHEED